MKKNLAIIGHKTRGKEIINILEMLGGKRGEKIAGNDLFSWYYINGNGCIDYKHYSLFDGDTIMLTLEQFLEKYPYKIGDKVEYIKYDDEEFSVYEIKGMMWTGNTIVYTLDSFGFTCLTKDIRLHKENNMNKNKNFKSLNVETYLKVWDETENGLEVCVAEGYELIEKDGQFYITKQKSIYPKTYEECCEVIGDCADCSLTCFACGLLNNLQRLLLCRDAYWEIADWTPDWNNDNQIKYIIVNRRNNIIKDTYTAKNAILAFPTEKMRDLFYENFKELIEECKELL